MKVKCAIFARVRTIPRSGVNFSGAISVVSVSTPCVTVFKVMRSLFFPLDRPSGCVVGVRNSVTFPWNTCTLGASTRSEHQHTRNTNTLEHQHQHRYEIGYLRKRSKCLRVVSSSWWCLERNDRRTMGSSDVCTLDTGMRVRESEQDGTRGMLRLEKQNCRISQLSVFKF